MVTWQYQSRKVNQCLLSNRIFENITTTNTKVLTVKMENHLTKQIFLQMFEMSTVYFHTTKLTIFEITKNIMQMLCWHSLHFIAYSQFQIG